MVYEYVCVFGPLPKHSKIHTYSGSSRVGFSGVANEPKIVITHTYPHANTHTAKLTHTHTLPQYRVDPIDGSMGFVAVNKERGLSFNGFGIRGDVIRQS